MRQCKQPQRAEIEGAQVEVTMQTGEVYLLMIGNEGTIYVEQVRGRNPAVSDFLGRCTMDPGAGD